MVICKQTLSTASLNTFLFPVIKVININFKTYFPHSECTVFEPRLGRLLLLRVSDAILTYYSRASG
jgi:hypothetical protein